MSPSNDRLGVESPTSTSYYRLISYSPLRMLKKLSSKHLLLLTIFVFSVPHLLWLYHSHFVSSSRYPYPLSRTNSASIEYLPTLPPLPLTTTQLPQPGQFFRDPYPILTFRTFVDLAEEEIQKRKLPTCSDQLGLKLARVYASSRTTICTNSSHLPSSYAECYPNRYNEFSAWWPYPETYCLSSNLAHQPTWGGGRQERGKFIGNCRRTKEAAELDKITGDEDWLGRELAHEKDFKCEQIEDHTAVFVHRQDQWNPYHVSEDIVTTLLGLAIVSISTPSLLSSAKLQLVFTDTYQVGSDHFAGLWDRIGYFPPRRLAIDPITSNTTCFSNAIHSVSAGASLLSAVGVGNQYSCASSLVWATSYYLRWLYGLPGPTIPLPDDSINVLWVSRDKFDALSIKQGDYTPWRNVRHIQDEPKVLSYLIEQMKALCQSDNCRYDDVMSDPILWSGGNGNTTAEGSKKALRFMHFDPTGVTLDTQVDIIGRANIFISMHGAALALSLFLPPSPSSTVVELMTDVSSPNFHYHNMAHNMGIGYQRITINIYNVDKAQLWKHLSDIIRKRL